MKLCAILIALTVVTATSDAADPTEEIRCLYTTQTAGGQFQLVPSQTLRVLRTSPSDRKFALPGDAPSAVVSINCVRSSPIPVPSDALVPEAGYALYISAPFSSGKPLVSLEKAEGRYVAKLMSGRLSRSEKKQLEAAVAAMNTGTNGSPSAGT